MADIFSIDILTLDKSIYSGSAEMLVAKSMDGEISILPGHADLLAWLDIGPLLILGKGPGNEMEIKEKIAVHGGFIEVGDDKVRILADMSEKAADIDLERAKNARERAEKRFKQSEEIDLVRAEASLKRAVNRLNIRSE